MGLISSHLFWTNARVQQQASATEVAEAELIG
jgi:hypothetical protein